MFIRVNGELDTLCLGISFQLRPLRSIQTPQGSTSASLSVYRPMSCLPRDLNENQLTSSWKNLCKVHRVSKIHWTTIVFSTSRNLNRNNLTSLPEELFQCSRDIRDLWVMRQTIEGSTTVDTLMVAMRAYVRRKAPRRCVSMAYHQWRALTVFVNLFLCAHATLMAYFSYAPCNDGWFRDWQQHLICHAHYYDNDVNDSNAESFPTNCC